jgi:hypothetical protein
VTLHLPNGQGESNGPFIGPAETSYRHSLRFRLLYAQRVYGREKWSMFELVTNKAAGMTFADFNREFVCEAPEVGSSGDRTWNEIPEALRRAGPFALGLGVCFVPAVFSVLRRGFVLPSVLFLAVIATTVALRASWQQRESTAVASLASEFVGGMSVLLSIATLALSLGELLRLVA